MTDALKITLTVKSLDLGTTYGTIETAMNWSYTPRLSRLGSFSFNMPIEDPDFAYLQHNRVVICTSEDRDGNTLNQGAGVINKISRRIQEGGNGATISGTCMLADLQYSLLDDFEVSSTSTKTPEYIHTLDKDNNSVIHASFPFGADYDVGSGGYTRGYLYLGDDTPIIGLPTVDLQIANTQTSTDGMKLEQFIGNWEDQVITDTTQSGSVPMGQDGAITWARQEGPIKENHDNVLAYWIRLSADQNGEVDLDDVFYDDIVATVVDVTTNDITDLLAEVSGWSLHSGSPAGTSDGTMNVYRGNALAALEDIKEQSQEDFRLPDLDGTKEIEWLASNPSSGVTAIAPTQSQADTVDSTKCFIKSLQVSSEAKELYTQVYPEGAGGSIAAADLSKCSDAFVTAFPTNYPGFTIDRTNNVIVSATQQSNLGITIPKHKRFKTMGTVHGTGKCKTVSEALARTAVKWLQNHDAPVNAYNLEVYDLDSEVLPGDTIHITYDHSYNDGTSALSIDDDFIVLEITYRIDQQGIKTASMKVADVPVYPRTEVEMLRDLARQETSFQSRRQPVAAELVDGAFAVGFTGGASGVLSHNPVTVDGSDVTGLTTVDFTTQVLSHDLTNIIGLGLVEDTGNGEIDLGTPGTLTASTGNSVTSSSHTHAITDTSDGAANHSTILSSDASGGIRLDRLEVTTVDSFVASGDLTLNSNDDIHFSPTGDNVVNSNMLFDGVGLAMALGQTPAAGEIMCNDFQGYGTNNLTILPGGSNQDIVIGATSGMDDVLINGEDVRITAADLADTTADSVTITATGTPGIVLDADGGIDLQVAGVNEDINLINSGAGNIHFDQSGSGVIRANSANWDLTPDGEMNVELGLVLGNMTDVATQGQLVLDQGASDDHAVQFISSDVAHGVTNNLPTDMYAYMKKASDTEGGLLTVSATEGNNALWNYGIVTTNDTARSTSATATFLLQGALKSGTSIGTNAANSNLLAVKDFTSTRFIVDKEGDLHLDATSNINAWDHENDVLALRGLQMEISKPETIKEQWFDHLAYNRDKLIDMGVLSDGGFISTKGYLALLTGAHIQQHARIEELEQKLKLLEG